VVDEIGFELVLTQRGLLAGQFGECFDYDAAAAVGADPESQPTRSSQLASSGIAGTTARRRSITQMEFTA
jgi:hypothetical protein